MQIKTILNSVHPIKGFVYERIRFIEAWGHRGLAVAVRPRSGTKAVCSGCGRPGPTYDALPTRRFRFVPLWGLVVYLVYAMRRVNCSTCGITVERVIRSRLEPLKTVARSVRDHRTLILNWFAAQKEFSRGIVEGLNYKIKLSLRKAYGYRSLNVAEVAFYHALGKLPEPEVTHEFC